MGNQVLLLVLVILFNFDNIITTLVLAPKSSTVRRRKGEEHDPTRNRRGL